LSPIATGSNTPGTQLETGERGEGQLQLLDRAVVHRDVDVVLQLLALHQAAGEKAHVADLAFVQRKSLFLQLERIHAGRIQRADYATGASAGHHVGMNAAGLQHLDHADMGKALGRAAAQRKPDLQLHRSSGDNRRRGFAMTGASRQQQGGK
jgi:hypothetical protein